jgi:tricorn protease interacting factor F2/3
MKINRYDIFLDINNQTGEYSGNEIVQLEDADPTIDVDSVGLVIKGLKVDGKSQKVTKREESFRITGLQKTSVKLEIDFTGQVSDLLTGLYRAKTPEGEEMFTTQFESTGARRAFPCFDRPDLKAVFGLTLRIDSDLDGISNMPVEKETIEDRRKTVKFMDTPRMSTYLVYIGIGKFDRLEAKFRDKNVSVVAVKGHLDTTDFPMNMTIRSLDFFESYFGIPFQLPKVDIIAVPQFAAGAMENWGAITFRETLVLVNKSTSMRAKKRVLEVIAHELTHQWFGDLVTMKWWNDLWLNESFATFMSYKVADRIYPEWKMFDYFMLSRMEGALNGDSLEGSHPIDVEVKDPDSISEIFDEISYGKGGSILRMIENYVGSEAFRKGIGTYLKDNSYGNAEGADLWNSIAKYSGGNISKIMESWIKRMGYPVITVSRNGSRLHMKQERYLLSSSRKEEPWPIPLVVRRNSGYESILFSSAEMEIQNSPIMTMNGNRSGFYRVLYEGPLLDEVISSVKEMNREEKMGLLSDYFAFMKSGRASFEDYRRVLKSLFEDEERLIIEAISTQLYELYLIKPESVDINKLGREFHELHYRKLSKGKTSEDDMETLGVITQRFAVFDHKFAEDESAKFGYIEAIKPDLRQGIAIAKALSSNSLKEIQDKFFSLKSDEDRTKLLSAMGYLKGKDNFEAVIQMINDGKVKRQDMVSYLSSAGMNPGNREFIMDELERIVLMIDKVFKGNNNASRYVETVLPIAGLIGSAKTNTVVVKMKSMKQVQRGFTKGLEVLRINENLAKKIK